MALWLASLLELVRSGSQCPLSLSGKVVALVLTAQSLCCPRFLHVSCAWPASLQDLPSGVPFVN